MVIGAINDDYLSLLSYVVGVVPSKSGCIWLLAVGLFAILMSLKRFFRSAKNERALQ